MTWSDVGPRNCPVRGYSLSLFNMIYDKRRRRGTGQVARVLFFFVGWSLMHLPLFQTCPMPSCMIIFFIQAQTKGQKEKEQEKGTGKRLDKVEAKSTRDKNTARQRKKS